MAVLLDQISTLSSINFDVFLVIILKSTSHLKIYIEIRYLLNPNSLQSTMFVILSSIIYFDVKFLG